MPYWRADPVIYSQLGPLKQAGVHSDELLTICIEWSFPEDDFVLHVSILYQFLLPSCSF